MKKILFLLICALVVSSWFIIVNQKDDTYTITVLSKDSDFDNVECNHYLTCITTGYKNSIQMYTEDYNLYSELEVGNTYIVTTDNSDYRIKKINKVITSDHKIIQKLQNTNMSDEETVQLIYELQNDIIDTLKGGVTK